MRIMSNISALNASNKLKLNNGNKAKNIEKLSSGLRINRAGDDAAGLAISEKMRAQIRGLDQASRNIQDGISLIQTAEGGMNEIHSILQRMNELAVQAANGSNTDKDRSNLNIEFSQLKQEINDISDRTHFNGISILNNRTNLFNGSPIQGEVILNWTSNFTNFSNQSISKASDGGYLCVSDYGAVYKIDRVGNLVWSKASSIKFSSIKETSDGGFVVLGNNSTDWPNRETTIDILKWDDNLNETWSTSVSGLYVDKGREIIEAKDGSYVLVGVGSGIQNADGLIAKFSKDGVQIRATVNGSSESIPVAYGGDEFNSIIELADGSFLAVGKSSLKINGVYSDRSSWIMKFDKDLNPLWDKRVGGVGTDEGFNAVATDDGGAIVVGTYNNSNVAYNTNGLIYRVDGNGKILWEKNISSRTNNSSLFTSIGTFGDDHYYVAGVVDSIYQVSIFNSEGSEIAIYNIDSDPNYPKYHNNIVINDDGSLTVATDLFIKNVKLSIEEEMQRRSLNLHIGANSKDNFLIEPPDIRTSTLEIDKLSIKTNKQATAALDSLKKAINIVSSERARLGAYQNRLEHAQNSVLNSVENLTAAESRIRDVDMAKEMMEYTKNQILTEAGQAMVAQANTIQQSILKLLG
jgi:flagellin